MHAGPQVKEILVARKLKPWSTIARYAYIEPSFPRARARKNYWRLSHRYREIAKKIGLHEWSVYGWWQKIDSLSVSGAGQGKWFLEQMTDLKSGNGIRCESAV